MPAGDRWRQIQFARDSGDSGSYGISDNSMLVNLFAQPRPQSPVAPFVIRHTNGIKAFQERESALGGFILGDEAYLVMRHGIGPAANSDRTYVLSHPTAGSSISSLFGDDVFWIASERYALIFNANIPAGDVTLLFDPQDTDGLYVMPDRHAAESVGYGQDFADGETVLRERSGYQIPSFTDETSLGGVVSEILKSADYFFGSSTDEGSYRALLSGISSSAENHFNLLTVFGYLLKSYPDTVFYNEDLEADDSITSYKTATDKLLSDFTESSGFFAEISPVSVGGGSDSITGVSSLTDYVTLDLNLGKILADERASSSRENPEWFRIYSVGTQWHIPNRDYTSTDFSFPGEEFDTGGTGTGIFGFSPGPRNPQGMRLSRSGALSFILVYHTDSLQPGSVVVQTGYYEVPDSAPGVLTMIYREDASLLNVSDLEDGHHRVRLLCDFSTFGRKTSRDQNFPEYGTDTVNAVYVRDATRFGGYNQYENPASRSPTDPAPTRGSETEDVLYIGYGNRPVSSLLRALSEFTAGANNILSRVRRSFQPVLDFNRRFGRAVLTGLGAPGSAAYQDGYFIVSEKDTRNFCVSELNDFVFDATSCGTKEGRTDNITAMVQSRSILFVFGDQSAEAFHNNGRTDFPFSRHVGALASVGAVSRDSVVTEHDEVFFLSSEGIVYRTTSLSPIPISTPTVEQEIGKGDITKAKAYVYTLGGLGTFYCLDVPGLDRTLVYDIGTNLWHYRVTPDKDGTWRQWRVKDVLRYGDRVLAFDRYDDQIGTMEDDYLEYGQAVFRQAQSSVLSVARNRVRIGAVRFFIRTEGIRGHFIFDYSNDYGRSYRGRRIGQLGRTTNHDSLMFSGLGTEPEWNFRLTMNQPYPVLIASAAARLKVGRN